MSWFDDWWRRRGKRKRDIDDFDKLFDEIFREFEKMFGDVGHPIVRGFSITIGPDGKPIFREFGSKPTFKEEEREVEIDIVEGKGFYDVIADMPGLRLEDIAIEFRDGKLLIKGMGVRKYYKVFDLPEDASNEIISKKYHNGVLTIRIKKKGVLKRLF